MSETRDDLREALARFIMEHSTYVVKEQAEWRADALIRGPLAPILAQVSALQAEVETLKADAERTFQHRNDLMDSLVSTRVTSAAATARAEKAEAEVERLQKVEGERGNDPGQAARLDALLDAGDRLFAAERAVNDACDRGEEIHAANVAAAHAGQMPDLDASRQNYSEASMAGAIRFAAEQDLHNALAIACASRSAARAANHSLTETKEGSEHVWPAGCIKPASCSRHRTCMYAQSTEKCRHFGKDLTAEIEDASHAR